AAAKKRVAPVKTPSSHQIVSLLDLCEHGGYIGWIVLSVAVHKHHDTAPGVGQPGRQRGRLSKVTLEADDAQSRVAALESAQDGEGAVPAAIIHCDNLVGLAYRR